MAQNIKDIIEIARDMYAEGATDLNRYVKDATRTESQINTVKTDHTYFRLALLDFIEASRKLDVVKKNTFYNKHFIDEKDFVPVDKIPNISPRLFHALIGILTEAGELAELLEKITLGGDDVDAQKVADELGDLNWYQAIAIDTLGLSFSSILRANIAKLKARYPEKFTSENAITRDTEKEDTALRDNLKG